MNTTTLYGRLIAFVLLINLIVPAPLFAGLDGANDGPASSGGDPGASIGMQEYGGNDGEGSGTDSASESADSDSTESEAESAANEAAEEAAAAVAEAAGAEVEAGATAGGIGGDGTRGGGTSYSNETTGVTVSASSNGSGEATVSVNGETVARIDGQDSAAVAKAAATAFEVNEAANFGMDVADIDMKESYQSGALTNNYGTKSTDTDPETGNIYGVEGVVMDQKNKDDIAKRTEDVIENRINAAFEEADGNLNSTRSSQDLTTAFGWIETSIVDPAALARTSYQDVSLGQKADLQTALTQEAAAYNQNRIDSAFAESYQAISAANQQIAQALQNSEGQLSDSQKTDLNGLLAMQAQLVETRGLEAAQNVNITYDANTQVATVQDFANEKVVAFSLADANSPTEVASAIQSNVGVITDNGYTTLSVNQVAPNILSGTALSALMNPSLTSSRTTLTTDIAAVKPIPTDQSKVDYVNSSDVVNLASLTAAQAVKMGLVTVSETDIENIGKTLAGEVDAKELSTFINNYNRYGLDVALSSLTTTNVKAAGIVTDTIFGRAYATAGALYGPFAGNISKAVTAPAQFSAFKNGELVTNRASYEQNKAAYDALARAFTNGTITSRFGLNAASPTPTADAYVADYVIDTTGWAQRSLSSALNLQEPLGKHIAFDLPGEYRGNLAQGAIDANNATIGLNTAFTDLSGANLALTGFDKLGTVNPTVADSADPERMSTGVSSSEFEGQSIVDKGITLASDLLGDILVPATADTTDDARATRSGLSDTKYGILTDAQTEVARAELDLTEAKQRASLEAIDSQAMFAYLDAEARYNDARASLNTLEKNINDLSIGQSFVQADQIARQAQASQLVSSLSASQEGLAQYSIIQNQLGTGKIRGEEISDELATQLQYAMDKTGLVFRVSSGGQMSLAEAEAAGAKVSRDANGNNIWTLPDGTVVRTGSTRHDHGESADGQIVDPVTGKALDMTNPTDQARMAEFISYAVAAGATGVGGSPNYMGNYTVHIGGGTSATWGAKGESTPGWLQAAYTKGKELAADYTPSQQVSRQPASEIISDFENYITKNGTQITGLNAGKYDIDTTTQTTKNNVPVPTPRPTDQDDSTGITTITENTVPVPTPRPTDYDTATQLAQTNPKTGYSTNKSVVGNPLNQMFNSDVVDVTAVGKGVSKVTNQNGELLGYVKDEEGTYTIISATEAEQAASQAEPYNNPSDGWYGFLQGLGSAGILPAANTRTGAAIINYANQISRPFALLADTMSTLNIQLPSGTDNRSPMVENENYRESGQDPITTAATKNMRTVPVTIQVDTNTKAVQISRPDLLGTLEDDSVPELAKDKIREALNAANIRPPLIFDETGALLYSDGLYAPYTVNGEVVDSQESIGYTYIIEYVANGEPVILDSNLDVLPTPSLIQKVTDLFANTDPFELEDVESITYVLIDPDSSVPRDEYYDYTLRLNDGTVRNVTVPEYTSVAVLKDRFNEVGFSGNVLSLLALSVQADTQQDLEKESIFAQVKMALQSMLNQFSDDDQVDYAQFPVNSSGTGPLESNIDAVTIYPITDLTCPNVPGLNQAYVYSVLVRGVANSQDSIIFDTKCGTLNPADVLYEIKSDLESKYGFATVDPLDLYTKTAVNSELAKLTRGVYFFEIEQDARTTPDEDSATTNNSDATGSSNDITVPNTTNTIVFEVKTTAANGSVKQDWGPATRVVMPSDGVIDFRWEADDYKRCIPFLADNGGYALTLDTNNTTVGNTEADNYTVPLKTTSYYLECGGQDNGEYGVDVKVIDVTVQ